MARARRIRPRRAAAVPARSNAYFCRYQRVGSTLYPLFIFFHAVIAQTRKRKAKTGGCEVKHENLPVRDSPFVASRIRGSRDSVERTGLGAWENNEIRRQDPANCGRPDEVAGP